ncbi:MAG TPA: 1-acyl-sn-glycerol-3-phosphate acyltransferase [Lacipirellulaceae bacterium]|jgi:1-acyl-sn-glycerol-3-phosphate acyltransferase
MQRVVIDEPYQFVPPAYSDWWPYFIRLYLPHYLRSAYGVYSVDSRHVERLRASVAAGNSIMLAPNHCRLADPMVLGKMALEADCYLFAMASWHLFKQSMFQSFMIRRMGAFSIYREGNDRQAIDTAIDILVSKQRPLIMFAEGAMTRHNDLVREMMDGPSFIARQAAKRLKKQNRPGQVVIHPVAIRYAFDGDLDKSVTPTLEHLETQLSWQPQSHLSLVGRIAKIGEAFLALKEVEFLGATQQGNPYQRAQHLIDSVLARLETDWQIKDATGGVIARVKRIRTAILTEMMATQLSIEERDRRWRDLAASYYVQQISNYPRDYILREKNLPERVIETVERLEEDFVDEARKYEPFHAVVEVGEAIPVGTQRDREATGDPIMDEVRRQLQSMISALAAERTPV